jgi:citrate lyase beta subunit
MPLRTLLCVPARRPELYENCFTYAAGGTRDDLEDSVPNHHKVSRRGVP